MSPTMDQVESLSSGFADAVASVSPSTVMVAARRRMPSTGIVYSTDLVVTANHAIEREEDLKITVEGGVELSASLAGRDPARDIALLKVKEGGLTAAKISQALPRIGQLVLALGRPDQNGLQASLGVVSAIGGPVRTSQGAILEKYLRTDATPFPGFSGGPLITVTGTVVGMNTSGLAMETLITIPSQDLWNAAATLAAHGHIRRPYLGIRSQVVELAEAQQEALGRKQERALLMVGVEENSPAAAAGLIVGDILVAFDQKPVSDHEELQGHISAGTAGKSVAVELLRGGKPLPLQVVLGER